jgi:hypothetical protein
MRDAEDKVTINAQRMSIGAFWRLLLLAPAATAAYYFAVKFAFLFSIENAVSDASDVSLPFAGGAAWGSHWLYRLFAEIVSVGSGTFVAGGLARKWGRLAGLIGGVSISVFYLIRNSYILFALFYVRDGITHLVEPWSQHVVEWLVVIVAPFVGILSGIVGAEVASRQPDGFRGINRLHFIWLWVAVFFYAMGMISPALHVWFDPSDNGIIRLVAFGPPLLIYGAPLFWGLSALAGNTNWSRRRANILGPLILLFGYFIAAAVVLVWAFFVAASLHWLHATFSNS